jgi:hypothetical protein
MNQSLAALAAVVNSLQQESVRRVLVHPLRQVHVAAEDLQEYVREVEQQTSLDEFVSWCRQNCDEEFLIDLDIVLDRFSQRNLPKTPVPSSAPSDSRTSKVATPEPSDESSQHGSESMRRSGAPPVAVSESGTQMEVDDFDLTVEEEPVSVQDVSQSAVPESEAEAIKQRVMMEQTLRDQRYRSSLRDLSSPKSNS